MQMPSSATSTRLAMRAPAVVAVLTFLATVLGPAAAADADSGRSRGLSSETATGWYLALGDSLAAGYQPDQGEDRDGGYVDDVLDALQVERPKTKLVNLACSGESTVTMIDGSRCADAYDEGSQLAQAVQFLDAHARRTRLITVTVGSNDITPCLRQQDVVGCAGQQLQVVHSNLTTILSALHQSAPGVPIIVTNYYNPYLALAFDPAREGLVPLTTALQRQLNATLADATSAATAGTGRIADVATSFNSYDTSPGGNGLPVNVATICAYTWMCSWTPPNIHPTDQGYDAIADAVIDQLQLEPVQG